MGPLARSVEDLAQSMNVITRPDWRDIYALPADGVDYVAGLAARPQGLRIAYSEAFGFGLPATPEVSALVRRTLAFFESLGATVTEIPPFFDYDLYDRLAPATFAGLRGLVAGVLGSLDRLSELLPEIQTAFERSASVTLDEFLGAKMLEPQAALQVAQSLKDFDFLITPTMPTTAFAADRCFPPEAKPGRYGYTFDMNPYTWLFNVTLQPATSVPCGIASDGLPVGVQIVGPRGADLQCLQLAAAYERARGALPLPPLVRP
jgi:aspartyl-tRNA(Asn)/glutamyl-tRNA(Gln) amidotransferase subunit A